MNAKMQAQQYIDTHKQSIHPRYRHHYHLMGEVGWINDPNGFSIFQDSYHLFYQYHPYSSKWGPMHWGHAVSNDLIKWTHLPIALAPQDIKKGADGGSVFSGSALEINGKHYLMYTDNWYYRQEQSIAVSTDGVQYKRLYDHPVLKAEDLPKGADSVDFRDPKIWLEQGVYNAIISSRAQDDSGQILLYQSTNLKDWTYINTICASNNTIGKMWECPDLFSLDDQDVLLVSPQYMNTNGYQHNNVHASLYLVGTYNKKTYEFQIDSYMDIDAGFDFYAPQTLLDKQGRRIMIAWMAMWERTMPTDELGHNWSGSMTLPRVLHMKDGTLYQEPIEELIQYRTNHRTLHQTISTRFDTKFTGKISELIVEIEPITAQEFGIVLFQGEHEQTVLSYDVSKQLFTFDRSLSGHPITGNLEYEPNATVRHTIISLQNNKLFLRLFLDVSSVEIFLQKGRQTMTGLVYPKEDSCGIQLFTKNGTATFTLDIWDLEVNQDE